VPSGEAATHIKGSSLKGSSQASSVSYESVTKVYEDGKAPAVDSLTLEVPAGEICVLVGPSGCGKTTAMRMVNRTVEMTSGDIKVGGESVRDRDAARLRREIGYVIQQIGLFPHRTISDNIGAVPQLLGWKKDRIRARSAELLELIGLDPELGDRYPAQLSGGQQQRVGVARALAADPLVMLMDEPFGAIDPINRERLQNEFLRLQAQVRKTVLFVTHDIDEAIKMGDRIAVMHEHGKVEQYATPAELLMEPANGFVEDFVGADRALKRLALMRVADIDLWEAPWATAGQPTSEVRAKLDSPDVEVPYPLLVDSERRPLGWLSERDLTHDTVPDRPDSPLGPVLDLADVMRDALSDMLQGGAQYAAVTDHDGRVAGVLSVEIISEFLVSPAAKVEEHSAAERPLGAEQVDD
jgi:osmoprotectant transport system ATP-binding protein